jgi:hypothetical protein
MYAAVSIIKLSTCHGRFLACLLATAKYNNVLLLIFPGKDRKGADSAEGILGVLLGVL